MHFGLYRAITLVAFVGSALVWPAATSADEPRVVLLTLVDGTACRGPITGTTFNLVDTRANYACADGRWIMGEPLTLGDGRQVAMVARTILQGQRMRDQDPPCDQPLCTVGVGQVEVATAASLPVIVKMFEPRGNHYTCTFQEGETFYLGTSRANYRCDLRGTRPRPYYPEQLEYWIVGTPFLMYRSPQLPELYVEVAMILREGTPLPEVINADKPPCAAPVCVIDLMIERVPT